MGRRVWARGQGAVGWGPGEGSFQDKQSSGVVLRPAEPAWPGHGRRGSGPGGLCPLPQPMLRAGGPALGAVSARGGQGGLTREGRSPELRPRAGQREPGRGGLGALR